MLSLKTPVGNSKRPNWILRLTLDQEIEGSNPSRPAKPNLRVRLARLTPFRNLLNLPWTSLQLACVRFIYGSLLLLTPMAGIGQQVEDFLTAGRASGLSPRTINDVYGYTLRSVVVPFCERHGGLGGQPDRSSAPQSALPRAPGAGRPAQQLRDPLLYQGLPQGGRPVPRMGQGGGGRVEAKAQWPVTPNASLTSSAVTRSRLSKMQRSPSGFHRFGSRTLAGERWLAGLTETPATRHRIPSPTSVKCLTR